MSFLDRKNAISEILAAGMDAMQSGAERIGVADGAAGVCIVYEGIIHVDYAAFKKDHKLAYAEPVSHDDDDLGMTDYYERAGQRLFKSLREKNNLLKKQSKNSSSNEADSFCSIYKDLDGTEFELHAVYAGKRSPCYKEICVDAVEEMRLKAAKLKEDLDKSSALLNHGPGVRGTAKGNGGVYEDHQ